MLPQSFSQINLVPHWLARERRAQLLRRRLSARPDLRRRACAEDHRDRRIRGGGQLLLSSRRRQVRAVPAEALLRKARRASRAGRRAARESGRERRHSQSRAPSRRARSRATCSSIAPASSRCCSARRSACRSRTAATCCSATPRWRCRCRTRAKPRRSPRTPSQPRNRPAGSGISACRRGAASATCFPAATSRTTRRSASCVTTSGRRARTCRCARSRSAPGIGKPSGSAIASPSGLAAGFLEPLESSAIVLIELSAKLIAEQMPVCREVMDVIAARFNATTEYRWGRIIDFLKLHYVLTQRTDSAFWRDNLLPETIPDRLQDLLLLWSISRRGSTTSSTASKKCSRPPATSTCCTAWDFAPRWSRSIGGDAKTRRARDARERDRRPNGCARDCRGIAT